MTFICFDQTDKKLIFFLAALSAVCMTLLFHGFADAGIDPHGRADIILLQPDGKKKDRAVSFLHDLHTDQWGNANDSCSSCHPKMGKHNWLSLKFMRQMYVDPVSVGMDQEKFYHTNCIGCHKNREKAGKSSGPTTVFCGKCHGTKYKNSSDFEPFEMGKSLHMRHIFNIDKASPIFSCKLCHHSYDAKLGQAVYKKGQEGSCRYCHKQTETVQHGDKVISLSDASHLICISCHRQRISQKATHGPITCSGCHGSKEQQEIQAHDKAYQSSHDFPQLERGQEEYCTVHLADNVPSPQWNHKVDFMPLVAFPHLSHENNEKSCRGCHHASMEPCAKRCHTLSGGAEGGYFTLREVMHSPNNTRGCVGCHAQQQAEKQCAGCHSPERRGVLRQSQCKACHIIDLEDPRKDNFSKTFLDRNFGQEGAKAMANRPRITTTYPDAAIPEKVDMGKLSKEWAPAAMPHRRIVKYLVGKAGASKLAAYFHSSQGTFCQGCHHHQPASKIPSACSNCHGNSLSRTLEKLPELKDAYHEACIGCHQRMGLDGKADGKKTVAPDPEDCQGCHKAKQ